MTASDIALLTEQMRTFIEQNPEISSGRALVRPVVRALAAGAPVAAESLADDLGWPPARVHRILHELPFARRDAADHLIGLFLSRYPSPHQVRIRGRNHYCQNPVDGLIAASVLDAPAWIKSTCALTGVPISLDAPFPAGDPHITPPSAVVSIVPAAGTSYRVASLMDANQLFFRDGDTAQVWLRAHRDCVVLTVHDAWRYAQNIAAMF